MSAVATHVDCAPRPRGRWARFSLRSCLVAVTLFAVAFGMFNSRVERQRHAAEAIERANGTIVYDWQIRPPDADPRIKAQPPGPAWLRSRLGPHWFDSIVTVRLNGFYRPEAREHYRAASRQLAHLRSLRELSVWGQGLDLDDYKTLGSLTQVEVLRLNLEKEIREEDAAALASAAGLRDIQISGARISAAALQQLVGLPRLEALTIDCNSYDRQTGKRITEWQLHDDAAVAIAELARLRKLMLFATQITDVGLATLCRLSELETLVVSSPHITSASFDDVAQLQRLEHLGTWQWRIDDADFAKLAAMPNLCSLGLVTQLTDASVPLVTALPHVRRLTLQGENVTDASLPHFQRLSRLEWLDLSDSSVDKLGAAAAELKRALPKCTLILPKTEAEIARERAFNDWKWGGAGSP